MAIQNRSEARASFHAGISQNQTWFQSFKSTLGDFVRGFDRKPYRPPQNAAQKAGKATYYAINAACVTSIIGGMGAVAAGLGMGASGNMPVDLGQATPLPAQNPEHLNYFIGGFYAFLAGGQAVWPYSAMNKIAKEVTKAEDSREQAQAKMATLDDQGQVARVDTFDPRTREVAIADTADLDPSEPGPTPS